MNESSITMHQEQEQEQMLNYKEKTTSTYDRGWQTEFLSREIVNN